MKSGNQLKITNAILTKRLGLGDEEMAQQLRTLIVLPEDLSLIPSIHRAAPNCNSCTRRSDTLTQTDIHAGKTPMLIKYK